MVSYQAWVSIVFEALDATGREVQNIDDGSTVMQFAATTWNQNRRTLSQATGAEAKSMAIELLQSR